MVSFMPGVGLMVRMLGLGSQDPEFKSHSAVDLMLGGVDSACHSSEVGKMSTSVAVEKLHTKGRGINGLIKSGIDVVQA